MKDRLFVSRHRIWQILTDAVLLTAALVLAYVLRFDLDVPKEYVHQFRWIVLPIVGVELLVFIVLGMYNKWWRYAGMRDLLSLALAVPVAVTAGVLVAALLSLKGIQPDIYGRWHNDITAYRLPFSVIFLDYVLVFGLMAGARLVSRLAWERPWRHELSRDRKKVLVVGAGDAGELVVREMLKSRQIRYRPVGFIDDDPRKKRLRIHNVPVVGTTRQLPRLIDQFSVEEVIIAIPSVGGGVVENIVLVCKKANVPVKTLPGVYELIRGSVTIEQLREVQVEDILGRQEVSVDLASEGSYLEGKVVLVTGAGGSIGSELSRQIATMNPRQLVLVDHSEGNLFEIQHELEDERRFSALAPVLIDIKDRDKTRALFARYRPQIVFHAAAYKHVPMIEANPVVAFENNSFATLGLVEAAVRYEAERVVFVSTDKAVEPLTVMGLSKAVCERIVETVARESDGTKLMSVRFGNVLGSSGSVVPIFKRQIASGGPVTVTDERMTRFFMTIPEAVRLVIQAGALGNGGEIFVLDMGEPIRIVDLARDMIRLSGLEPERDIEIEFTGVRPGEKLDEKLFNDGEQVVGTEHPKIAMAVRRPLPRAFLRRELEKIRKALADDDVEGAIRVAHELVRVTNPPAQVTSIAPARPAASS